MLVSVSHTPPKPLLVYDGDCGFCRLWIDRWKALTEERVAYAPYQEVADQFPEISREDFARSVQLILPDGEVFSAAHAVFRTLENAPGKAWMLSLYLALPGVAFVSELAYRFVASHRPFFHTLTRLFWGPHFERPSFVLSRWLFLRLLALSYFFAFLSLSTQIIGLLGKQGILPVGDYLELIRSNLGTERYWYFPTLAWVNASDGFLHFLTLGGALIALLVFLGFWNRPLLAILWVFYLSIVAIGQDFLSFQWDILLLETGFLAIFFAPRGLRPWGGDPQPPSRTILWLFRLLLFRLMFSSGAVKLLSGDRAWRRLTALEFHYETQPLPTRLAWYVHQLPGWFHKSSTVFMFFVELVVPFFVFAPRRLRFLATSLLGLLQVLIAMTGNYCFFNLLAIALCLLLFDDASLSKFFPRRLAERLRATPACLPRLNRRWRVWALAALATLIIAAGVFQLSDLFARRRPPRLALQFLRIIQPLHIVNGYGLFAVMTTSRPEIIIEGSNDGITWFPYEFRYKPGDVREAPRWAEPFQPRLDWQMWFAALSNYQAEPWFVEFVLRLLRGSPDVLALLKKNPFPQAPPPYIRALIYDYHFTNWSTREEEGTWWRRELRGTYLPAVSLRQPREAD